MGLEVAAREGARQRRSTVVRIDPARSRKRPETFGRIADELPVKLLLPAALLCLGAVIYALVRFCRVLLVEREPPDPAERLRQKKPEFPPNVVPLATARGERAARGVEDDEGV